jgi:hypothetical protein
LTRELIAWVGSLPHGFSLYPAGSERDSHLDRDIQLLHLPYLTTISLLYLRKSSQPLPKASIAAIVAASCVARIFEGYLARGSLRFLPGQSGWYITIAILALLHGRCVEAMTPAADGHIRTLRTALKQMALLWHSARMFDLGFDKLLGSDLNTTTELARAHPIQNGSHPVESPSLDELCADDGINWKDFFPCVTASTSPLIRVILEDQMAMPLEELDWPMDFDTELHDLFEQVVWNGDILNTSV